MPKKKDTPEKPATIVKRRAKAKPEVSVAATTQAQRTADQARVALKQMERNFYDIQRLRLQAEGRTTRKADGAQILLHPDDLAAIGARKDELVLVEKHVLTDIQRLLDTMPFYQDVLSKKPDYRGVGPTMSAVILSEFDFARQTTPSQAWSFAGLRPVDAMRCKHCQAVVDKYDEEQHMHGANAYRHRVARARPSGPSDAPAKKEVATKCTGPTPLRDVDVFKSGEAMRPQRGQKLPYNAFLRAKMVGVLAEVLIKVKSPWAKFYYDYKHRKESAGWGRSPGHRDYAAKRYMIKMLILDIWTKYRTYHGLEVRSSYQEQYLGHTHVGGSTSANGTNGVRHEPDLDPEVAAELEQASL